MGWVETQTLPDQWQAARSRSYLAYVQLYIIAASETTNAAVLTIEQCGRIQTHCRLSNMQASLDGQVFPIDTVL